MQPILIAWDSNDYPVDEKYFDVEVVIKVPQHTFITIWLRHKRIVVIAGAGGITDLQIHRALDQFYAENINTPDAWTYVSQIIQTAEFTYRAEE